MSPTNTQQHEYWTVVWCGEKTHKIALVIVFMSSHRKNHFQLRDVEEWPSIGCVSIAYSIVTSQINDFRLATRYVPWFVQVRSPISKSVHFLKKWYLVDFITPTHTHTNVLKEFHEHCKYTSKRARTNSWFDIHLRKWEWVERHCKLFEHIPRAIRPSCFNTSIPPTHRLEWTIQITV